MLCCVLLQVGEPANTGKKKQSVRNVRVRIPLSSPFLHSHCLLVWFEQLVGELAEDSQVGEVRRCSVVWSLVELLEHKLDAVSKQIHK